MYLVEMHQIKKNHKDFTKLDNICFLSKNLYNSTLYAIRQHYFETKEYLNYYEVNKKFCVENQKDYRALPAQIAQQTLKLVDANFLSFFKSRKAGIASARIPKYLDPVVGRQVVHIPKQYIKKQDQSVYIRQFDLRLKTKVETIEYINIIPDNQRIFISVAYKVDCKEPIESENYAGLDLGVDNLATVTLTNSNPLIINGKPLKSINQYYNKKLAYYKSTLETCNNKKSSNSIVKLTQKRNNKIKDYMHKASNKIVNHLVSNQISLLVIGYNKNWKQDTNIGKRNNQNFVQIPFLSFVNMLKYKCQLQGISVQTVEEAHTSKCSFLDYESIEHHDEYMGRRIKRGLFKTKDGICINADVNGSLNILRKFLIKNEIGDIYQMMINPIEGAVSRPVKVVV